MTDVVTAPGSSTPSAALTARARRAVTGVFFVNGLLVGTYLVRIPALKAGLGLTESELGAVLTCWGVAAVLTMQLLGRLVARVGSAPIIRFALAALPFALFGIGLAGNAWQLAVAVSVGGALVGTLDVAMNAHAVVVERVLARPVLNSCHAAVSLSSIGASLLGAATIRAGWSMAEHTLCVGAVLLVAGVLITRGLLPATADRANGSGPAGTPRRRAGWRGPVLLFGLLGLALMLCEAAVISWSGVFLHEDRGATLTVAAFGYTAFTVCQTLGRLAGDPLTARLGRARLFRVHALISVAGFAAVVAGPSTAVTLAGFAVVGYGSSVLVPLVFSAVGHAGGEGPGAAALVARATTFVYAGILVGPALAGWLGQLVGLAWTFAALIPLMVAAAFGARLMRAGD
ncbi:MFS transporter [Amycolatopsis sp. NPDC005003]